MRRIPLFLPLTAVLLFSIAAEAAFRTERVPLMTSWGLPINVEIRKPKKLTRERLPVVMIFGGFENGGRVLDLFKTNREVLLASFDYPYTAPRQFEFPGSLAHAEDVKKMMHATVEGILKLHEYLLARPDVDAERITIIGASLGAPFAVLAGAKGKIPGVVLVHGFGEIPETAQRRLETVWEGKLGWFAAPAAWLFSRISWIFLWMEAPESAARGFSRDQKILMIRAEKDSFVPRSASDSLWDAITRSGARAEQQMTPGDHLQPGSDALIERILERVDLWMVRQGLLDPPIDGR